MMRDLAPVNQVLTAELDRDHQALADVLDHDIQSDVPDLEVSPGPVKGQIRMGERVVPVVVKEVGVGVVPRVVQVEGANQEDHQQVTLRITLLIMLM